MLNRFRSYWQTTSVAQRVLYITGSVLFLWMVVHIALLIFTDTPLHGPVSYRKAATFAETGWLMCWAVGYVMPYLSLRRWSVLAIVGGTLAFGAGETLLMSVQMWRGVPSHYNFTTAINTALFSATGVIAFLWLLAMIVLLAAVWRSATSGDGFDRSMKLAYVTGTGLYIYGGVTGFLMMFNLGGLYQGEFLQNAQVVVMGNMIGTFTGPAPDEVGGNIVLLHALGVHGISLTALVPWLLGYTTLYERSRYRLTLATTLGWLAVMAVLTVGVWSALPLTQFGVVLWGLIAAIGLVLAGVYGIAAARGIPGVLQPADATAVVG